MTTHSTYIDAHKLGFNPYATQESPRIEPIQRPGVDETLLQNEGLRNDSLTADCLRVPIQFLSLEIWDETNQLEKSDLSALVQNIFQFSGADREEIYNQLQINKETKEHLRSLHKSNSLSFQKELKKCLDSFAQNIKLEPGENIVIRLAEDLGINLVILKQEEEKIEIVQDLFSTATCNESSHPCFASSITVAIAERKALFTKSKENVVSIKCDSQSLAKIREVYAEFKQITKNIFAIHCSEKTLDNLTTDPYYFWYQHHTHEGKLNCETALKELYAAKLEFQDFSESVLKQEIRSYPLAVIRQSSSFKFSQTGDTHFEYRAIDLKKLQESSLNTYGLLALCKALENILEFVDYRKLDPSFFEILYQGRSIDQVSREYDKNLDRILKFLGIKDELSLDDKQISDKLNFLLCNLQTQLPKELRGGRTFLSDPRFEQLREIAIFIQKKNFIKSLAEKIFGKNVSDLKRNLYKYGKNLDSSKLQQLKSSSIEQIIVILFQEFYQENYNQKLKEYSECLHEISQNLYPKKKWSIDDTYILDEINTILFPHLQDKKKELHEKSLDQLCKEYGELNHISPSKMSRIKSQILNIRLSIENLKRGKTLPEDVDQDYPIALIANICVKIEKTFGDMLRDTQLLAILSMLDLSNPKGELSQLETGEGKTYVIVALAIIKNKQGHEVDVITSSPTLAKRDVEKFKNFYKQEFGISCDHNCDSQQGMMANPCYQPHSIVYGTTASFEGDSLRSEFYQAKTFNGRRRGIAIVDEADSILLDKASWLCQISDSVAGMSTVRPLLYYIWALVAKKVSEASEKKIETQEDYDAFLLEIKDEVTRNIDQFFSPNQSFLVPENLKEFVKYRIPYWIDSALKAIFYSHNREYNACKVLKKITPIDYANTGEWEKDVQWEDGLHQFLQMKNGMSVETETLTKSFMSNYTLINKYSSIYGLSGTLGEEEEAKTFKELYGLEVRKIPKFKICRYEEKSAWISVDQQQWLDSLYADVVTDGLLDNAPRKNDLPSSQTERARSTLIICKTIADVKEIEKYFLNKGMNNIVTYTEGDEDKAKIKEATKGKIIIATNLSGRGTDIDASSIEKAGGLHVIFSFLPGNRRIQDQGFGRTARKGLSGTSRLIIKQEEIREHHLEKKHSSLLDVCNDPSKTNLKGSKIEYLNSLWEIESDNFSRTARELKIKNNGKPSEVKTIRLFYLNPSRESNKNTEIKKTYNRVEIDRVLLRNSEDLQFCSFSLTYDSIMSGRNKMEKARLASLRSDEKESLITKQQLFQNFQECFHKLSQGFTLDLRLQTICDKLLEVYKSYVLDEWAIFQDRVSKDLESPKLQSFKYAQNLIEMIGKNDLYKMQYINASIDVDNPEIRQEADAFYAERGKKVDITGGFAWYNRVFVTLKNNKANISQAKDYLEKAKKIFEQGEEYEKKILKVQYTVSCPDDSKLSQDDMEGTPLLRLILTMKALIQRNLKELETLEKDYSKLKVSFANPYDLKENPSSSTQEKDSDEKGYTIPDELMQEAIKLGLKGPLKLEGEGDLWKAIVCAIACVVVAIAVITVIALSGGMAAPLVALVGGKVAFGVITGAIAGAAISGAINSIKGAVNGDFSANRFGKDVVTGLITGAISGGVAAGLSGLASGALEVAGTLTRVGINAGSRTLQIVGTLTKVGINAGIGAASGAVAGGTGYVTGSLLHGRGMTCADFGKSTLHGAIGGALGGGAVGIAPHGTNSIRWAMLTGTLGSTAGNAAIQGVQIAMGDRKDFDGLELLENGLQGGVQAGIMAAAHKHAAKQADQRHAVKQANQERNSQPNNFTQNSKKEALQMGEITLQMCEKLLEASLRAGGKPSINIKPAPQAETPQNTPQNTAKQSGVDHVSKPLERKGSTSLNRRNSFQVTPQSQKSGQVLSQQLPNAQSTTSDLPVAPSHQRSYPDPQIMVPHQTFETDSQQEVINRSPNLLDSRTIQNTPTSQDNIGTTLGRNKNQGIYVKEKWMTYSNKSLSLTLIPTRGRIIASDAHLVRKQIESSMRKGKDSMLVISGTHGDERGQTVLDDSSLGHEEFYKEDDEIFNNQIKLNERPIQVIDLRDYVEPNALYEYLLKKKPTHILLNFCHSKKALSSGKLSKIIQQYLETSQLKEPKNRNDSSYAEPNSRKLIFGQKARKTSTNENHLNAFRTPIQFERSARRDNTQRILGSEGATKTTKFYNTISRQNNIITSNVKKLQKIAAGDQQNLSKEFSKFMEDLEADCIQFEVERIFETEEILDTEEVLHEINKDFKRFSSGSENERELSSFIEKRISEEEANRRQTRPRSASIESHLDYLGKKCQPCQFRSEESPSLNSLCRLITNPVDELKEIYQQNKQREKNEKVELDQSEINKIESIAEAILSDSAQNSTPSDWNKDCVAIGYKKDEKNTFYIASNDRYLKTEEVGKRFLRLKSLINNVDLLQPFEKFFSKELDIILLPTDKAKEASSSSFARLIADPNSELKKIFEQKECRKPNQAEKKQIEDLAEKITGKGNLKWGAKAKDLLAVSVEKNKQQTKIIVGKNKNPSKNKLDGNLTADLTNDTINLRLKNLRQHLSGQELLAPFAHFFSENILIHTDLNISLENQAERNTTEHAELKVIAKIMDEALDKKDANLIDEYKLGISKFCCQQCYAPIASTSFRVQGSSGNLFPCKQPESRVKHRVLDKRARQAREYGDNEEMFKSEHPPRRPSIFDGPSLNMREQEFEHNGETYTTKSTRGDGACALHALLGEEIDGEYRFPGNSEDSDVRVRSRFTQELREQVASGNEAIIQRLRNVIQPLIQAASQNSSRDQSAAMLFRSSEAGRQLVNRWNDLQTQYNENFQHLNNQQAHAWMRVISIAGNPILTPLMQEISPTNFLYTYRENQQTVLRLLRQNPLEILNLVNADPERFLGLLEDDEFQQISAIRENREVTLNRLAQEEADFMIHEEMLDHYGTIASLEDYYFNTQEIELAAYLFNKRVQVVSSGAEGVTASERLMNENGTGELVVIYHEGVHFERCIKLENEATVSYSSICLVS